MTVAAPITVTCNLAKVVARASFLHERLNTTVFSPAPSTPNAIQARLRRWQQEGARGDEEQFRRRLEWQGWSDAALLPYLGDVQLNQPTDLPAWARDLGALVDYTVVSGEVQGSTAHRAVDPAEPFPYQDLFLPWLRHGADAVAALVGDAYESLSDAAHAALERALLRQLCTLAAASLELEFAVHRAATTQGLSRFVSPQNAPVTRDAYDQFLRFMLEGGIGLFFEEYAALARLLATRWRMWITVSAEFILRLVQDADALLTEFGEAGESFFPVATLNTSLSDSHNEGRSVIIVSMASGRKVVYKPKDVGLEAAWYALLAWFNTRDPLHPFKVFTILEREHYGWVEFVDHETCATPDALHRYYQRSGMLLALFYALEATDNHLENIIAHGEHPVLIDMEALMHQRHTSDARLNEGRSAPREAMDQISNSVLRTGFLPVWMVQNNKSYDGSGLASQGDQRTGIKTATWQNVNTDQMRLVSDTYIMKGEVNSPSLNGVAARLEDHIDDIVLGFSHLYQMFERDRDAMLAEAGPLAFMFRQKARYINRNTSVYVGTLQRARHPKYMREGIDLTLLFDSLTLAATREPERSLAWDVAMAEIEALEGGDIPIFLAQANDTTLYDAKHAIVHNYFAAPAATWVTQRLQTLSAQDLDRQVGLIRGSLYARVTPTATTTDTAVAFDPDAPLLTSDEFIAEAERIADELYSRAIHGKDGSLTWVALGLLLYADRYQLQPLGTDLYNGLSGIAVFYAALAAATKRDVYRDYALRVLQPIREQVQDPRRLRRLTQFVGVGVAVGIGSLVYTFATVGELLNEPSLIEEARYLVKTMPAEQIQSDTDLDVAKGAAGWIMAIMKLYELTHDEALLDQAEVAARYLLERRMRSPQGYQVWATADNVFLSGILHGAGGTAYALLRLHQYRPTAVYYEAAQEALAFEESLYVTERNQWLPHEGAEPQRIMKTWCHGAPGIGMARIGSLMGMESELLQGDIHRSITATRAAGLRGIDHLCCGNFGQLDLLVHAHDHNLDADGLADARQWGSQLVQRQRTTGAYRFSPDLPADIYQPGLFSGMAGVGYALLRLAVPDTIPSVLAWA